MPADHVYDIDGAPKEELWCAPCGTAFLFVR
jgi:hypothetical protein